MGTRPIITKMEEEVCFFFTEWIKINPISSIDDGFFLFDFDRTTGQLSNYRRIPVTDSLVLDGGACFLHREGFCM
ncbi:MAG: hypothetical protein IPI30_03385 [Saprospiraceae bacterium]|nr:hypothetical protein [Candidatus Vicinibacter affinis]